MTGKTRLAICAGTVAAVAALCIDWHPGQPARRRPQPSRPAGRKTTRRPALRTVRLDFADPEVFARFADIVEADRAAENVPHQRTEEDK